MHDCTESMLPFLSSQHLAAHKCISACKKWTVFDHFQCRYHNECAMRPGTSQSDQRTDPFQIPRDFKSFQHIFFAIPNLPAFYVTPSDPDRRLFWSFRLRRVAVVVQLLRSFWSNFSFFHNFIKQEPASWMLRECLCRPQTKI